MVSLLHRATINNQRLMTMLAALMTLLCDASTLALQNVTITRHVQRSSSTCLYIQISHRCYQAYNFTTHRELLVP